ncbi:MAG: DUF342 domain-containing protein [Phycisphaerales bacterium]|nr:DUF342 domain-containing protein [Phycisphaerales bacterium]
MDDPPASNVEEDGFTSKHTQRIVREAHFKLHEELTTEQVEEQFAKLAAAGEDLDELELKRLAELAKLLEADPDSTEKLDALKRDGFFEITASKDGMTLVVGVHPPVAHGRAVDVADIMEWIADRGTTEGIDEEAIHDAVAQAASGEMVKDTVIVRGEPPKPGRNARLELFARQAPDQLPELLGSPDEVDENSQPWLCADGDRILRRIPEQPGTPGHDAFGNAIAPPDPKPVEVETGPNVRNEGDDYIAEASGVILFGRNHIEVRRMLVLGEDITRKRGLVEFDGDVVVRAGVRNGASLKATGNIVIEGPVEAAKVESTGGDVELRHGVAGHHRAEIRAAGSVTTRFSENAAIYAEHNIIINSGSLHSRLIAGQAIFVTQGRGQLIGGSAAAGEMVEAKQYGSSTGVPTEVLVGLEKSAMQALAKIDTAISDIRLKRDQAAELADRIQRAIGDPTKLKSEELKTYTALRKCEFVTDHQIRMLEEDRRVVLAEAAENHTGHVDALNELMPRVVVRIGNAVLDNDDAIRRCRIVYDSVSEKIVVQDLR